MEILNKFRVSLIELMQENEKSIKDLSSIGVSERMIRFWLKEP